MFERFLKWLFLTLINVVWMLIQSMLIMVLWNDFIMKLGMFAKMDFVTAVASVFFVWLLTSRYDAHEEAKKVEEN